MSLIAKVCNNVVQKKFLILEDLHFLYCSLKNVQYKKIVVTQKPESTVLENPLYVHYVDHACFLQVSTVVS